MKNTKIMKAIAKIGESSAKQTNHWYCGSILHQPKAPAKLLEMKNKK